MQPRPTNLKADYSKSEVEVYIDAIKAVILQDNNLRILAFCERVSADTPLLDGRERQQIQNLPSWVPDFVTNDFLLLYLEDMSIGKEKQFSKNLSRFECLAIYPLLYL